MTHEWQPSPAVEDPREVTVKMKRELSDGLHDSFAILETNHKRKQIGTGGAARPAVQGKWTTRTGQLRRSFTIEQKKGDLSGSYGSDLKRAGMIERGGTIRPTRSKFLAIPLPHLKVGVGAAPGPRDFGNLFFITSKAGNLLLVRPVSGGGIQPMFVLKTQVTMPKRPTLDKAVKATDSARVKRMNDAVAKGVNPDG